MRTTCTGGKMFGKRLKMILPFPLVININIIFLFIHIVLLWRCDDEVDDIQQEWHFNLKDQMVCPTLCSMESPIGFTRRRCLAPTLLTISMGNSHPSQIIIFSLPHLCSLPGSGPGLPSPSSTIHSCQSLGFHLWIWWRRLRTDHWPGTRTMETQER